MLEEVKKSLKNAGIDYATTKRGLDHGVWGESPLDFALLTLSPVQGGLQRQHADPDYPGVFTRRQLPCQ